MRNTTGRSAEARDAAARDERTPHYRGRDRRAQAYVPTEFDTRPGLLALAAVAAGVVLIPGADGVIGRLAYVDGSSAAIASITGIALLLQWRLDGRAASWWLGLGFMVLAVPGFAGAATGRVDVSLKVCALGAAVSLFAVAWRSPDIDTRLSWVRAALLLSGAITAITLLDAGLSVGTSLLRPAAIAASGSFAGCTLVWMHRPKQKSWMVLSLAGFAIVSALYALTNDDAQRGVEAGIIQFLISPIAAIGAIATLHNTAVHHRAAALVAETERALADSRHTALEARYAETLHEVRSAVVALEGGVRRFEPVDDAESAQQAALARALVAELRRLRGLVEVPSTAHDSDISVRASLDSMLTVCIAGGWPVTCDIPDDLYVRAGAADVAQIVLALVTNARRHAPKSRIEVSAYRDRGRVAICVDDRGPGVKRSDRELIFERGRRSAASAADDGKGLGLHIARRLARDLDGDLWVEERPGGGARFVLALPVPAAKAATA